MRYDIRTIDDLDLSGFDLGDRIVIFLVDHKPIRIRAVHKGFMLEECDEKGNVIELKPRENGTVSPEKATASEPEDP